MALEVSVIVPTYNRYNQLLTCVDALARQTFPTEQYEVIVVDDGSTDETPTIKDMRYPLGLKYVRQPNRGATLARNTGAQASSGAFLVFVDDDIELLPATIAGLHSALCRSNRTIVLGTLLSPSKEHRSMFAMRPQEHRQAVPFTECLSGLLSIRASEFFELGMFKDPTGGWPNWDDIDFGYRAALAGFQLQRECSALGIHHDKSATTLGTICDRSYQASKSAVRLFKRYPAIQPEFPMFHDKTPVDWRRDPPLLILRKVLRQAASSSPLLPLLERAAKTLERVYPSPFLLRPLYRWIIGGYIFRGYRQGLRDLKKAGA